MCTKCNFRLFLLVSSSMSEVLFKKKKKQMVQVVLASDFYNTLLRCKIKYRYMYFTGRGLFSLIDLTELNFQFLFFLILITVFNAIMFPYTCFQIIFIFHWLLLKKREIFMKEEIVHGGFEISFRYLVTSINVCGPFGTLFWKRQIKL